MSSEAYHKITASHLARTAYLYVRQSTLRQVLENTESTTRQYALRERAVALGWPLENVVVIDSDLGQSGASAADREGFQRLVTEVSLGRAGIVLGLEVSRLARNNSDWHRLLELCALADTLILDEDGLYDPAHFNDRLLLGLKGTMSEAELHVLKARLRGGILSRARRGELKQGLPIGYIHDAEARVILDPDAQVQAAVRLLFDTFRRTGTCLAVAKEFRAQRLTFPQRIRSGPKKGQLHWDELLQFRVRQIIHNPCYAGAFAFGRTRQQYRPDGRSSRRVPADDWILVRDMHPAYISWEEYEENVRRVQANAAAWGPDRRHGPPREGIALLQGLVICGTCGERMTVRYHSDHGIQLPTYWCGRRKVQRGESGLCQTINGAALDREIGDLLVELMSPLAIDVALAVQQELVTREEQADRLRRQHVERARYEADLAERRFFQVDPDHRLVADALEADWNAKLRLLANAQEQYERAKAAQGTIIGNGERADLLALATDFPRLWRNPATSMKDKKRMARLLIKDVTLIKQRDVMAHIRFPGGATHTLTLAAPLSAADLRRTDPAVVRRVDELLEHYTEHEVAEKLNQEGMRSGTGISFNPIIVAHIRYNYGLRTRYQRLRAKGLLTVHEMAARLRVCTQTVKIWRSAGLLKAYPYSSKNECLYEPPGPNRPKKHTWKGISAQRRSRNDTPSYG
jgi:DNA invertase Pin-like site-specific DNA recombinase